MLHLASPGQMSADHHLEEVEGRVQTVLVELQLAAQVMDLTLTCTGSDILHILGCSWEQDT